MKKQFIMAVQTKKNVENGEVGTVFAHGTKKHCIEQMEKWFGVEGTVRAWVVREKDREVVAELRS